MSPSSAHDTETGWEEGKGLEGTETQQERSSPASQLSEHGLRRDDSRRSSVENLAAEERILDEISQANDVAGLELTEDKFRRIALTGHTKEGLTDSCAQHHCSTSRRLHPNDAVAVNSAVQMNENCMNSNPSPPSINPGFSLSMDEDCVTRVSPPLRGSTASPPKSSESSARSHAGMPCMCAYARVRV